MSTPIGIPMIAADGRRALVSYIDRPDVQLEPWRLILLRAADVIEKRGHYQLLPHQQDPSLLPNLNKNGPTCAILAIGSAGKELIDEGLLSRDRSIFGYAEMASIRLREKIPGKFIAYWSDHTPTVEVLETIRRVALS